MLKEPRTASEQTIASGVRGQVSGARVLGVLLLTYIFNLMDRQIVGILAVPIKADLELTDTQLGLLGGFAFVVFYTVLGIPIAWLADRRSRITIITVSLGLWSAFTAVCGAAQNFWQLFLARTGVGVGEAGGVAPAYSLITDYFPPERRGRALAIFSLGAPIGVAVGVLFGGWIASTFHWRAAFVVVGVAGLLLVPIVKLAIPEPVRGRLDGIAEQASVAAPAFTTAAARIVASPSFWLLSVGAAASAIPSAGLVFWLASFLRRSFELELSSISVFLGSIMLIGGASGVWLGGWLGDKLGKRNPGGYAITPAVAFLFAVPVIAAALFAPTLAAGWFLFLLWYALVLIWLGPTIAAVQHIFPPNMRATASAMFLFINNMCGIGFGTFFVGFMSDEMAARYGEEALRYSMLYSLIFYLVAFVLFGIAAWRLKRDWYRPAPAAC